MANATSETESTLSGRKAEAAGPSGIHPGPDAKHPYVRRKLGSPCPAIATMINHSYLTPRDATDRIPWYELVWALISCYNFSIPFALIFVFVANLRLGTLRGFSIEQLGKHGLIEHDASITRYNIDEGDYLNPQDPLINDFLDSVNYPKYLSENKKMITLSDYAKKRVAVEKKVMSYPPGQSKSHVRLLGIGESVLALQVFEDKEVNLAEGKICARAQWLRTWYRDERLPVDLGWNTKIPQTRITLHRLLWNALQFYQVMKGYDEKRA